MLRLFRKKKETCICGKEIGKEDLLCPDCMPIFKKAMESSTYIDKLLDNYIGFIITKVEVDNDLELSEGQTHKALLELKDDIADSIRHKVEWWLEREGLL